MGVSVDDYDKVYLILFDLYGWDYHLARRQPVRIVGKALDALRRRMKAREAKEKEQARDRKIQAMEFQNLQTLAQAGIRV